METFWIGLIIAVSLFLVTMSTFLVMEKTVMEDYTALDAFVEKCVNNPMNHLYCSEELGRIIDTGLLPQRMADEMRAKITVKFK